MDKKKILIVSTSFFPENSPRSFRATELALELARQKHEVFILTINRGIDYNNYAKNHTLQFLPFLNVKNYDANRFSSKRNLLTRIIDRILYQTILYPEINIAFAIRKILKPNSLSFDAVISIAKPYSTHFGIAFLSKKLREKLGVWVADCGDPFTGNNLQKRKFPFYMNSAEKWMLKKTNYISIPVSSAKNAYPSSVHSKLRVIPQGFNFADTQIAKEINSKEYPVFAYAGAFYKDLRDPGELLNYLSSLNCDFKFIIYTSTTQLIEPYQKVLQDKLEIKNSIPREKLIFELSKMDFLINLENKTNVMVPSKFIDYSLTKRPILNIKPDQFNKNEVDDFLNGNYSNALIVKDLERYNIKNVAIGFLNLINLEKP